MFPNPGPCPKKRLKEWRGNIRAHCQSLIIGQRLPPEEDTESVCMCRDTHITQKYALANEITQDYTMSLQVAAGLGTVYVCKILYGHNFQEALGPISWSSLAKASTRGRESHILSWHPFRRIVDLECSASSSSPTSACSRTTPRASPAGAWQTSARRSPVKNLPPPLATSLSQP